MKDCDDISNSSVMCINEAINKLLTQTRRLHGHEEDILCVAFCPPTLLATGSYDGVILVWNLQSGALKTHHRFADENAATVFQKRHVPRPSLWIK